MLVPVLASPPSSQVAPLLRLRGPDPSTGSSSSTATSPAPGYIPYSSAVSGIFTLRVNTETTAAALTGPEPRRCRNLTLVKLTSEFRTPL